VTPTASSALARLLYGAMMPVALLRAISREPQLKTRFRRTVLTQLAVASALAVLLLPGALKGLDLAVARGGEVGPKGPVVRFDSKDEPKRRTVSLEAAAKALATSRQNHTEVLDELVAEADRTPAQQGPTPPREVTLMLTFLAAVWGVLKLIDSLVAMLFQEHNDALTHVASKVLSHRVEEGPERPRIRISLRWMVGRIKRQLGGLLMLACSMPLLLLLSELPWVGSTAYGLFGAAWGFYWFAVLTTAKTSAAWAPGPEREPWFLRALSAATDRGVLAWWAPRLYVKLLRRVSRALRPPAVAFERAPAELVGLSLLRVAAGLPVVSICFRPVLPIAAAQLLGPAPEHRPAPVDLPALEPVTNAAALSPVAESAPASAAPGADELSRTAPPCIGSCTSPTEVPGARPRTPAEVAISPRTP
jgi:hypothetical protein